MINRAKYLSLMVLLGAWGCTTNQYVSRSGGGYDDLYGGGSAVGDRYVNQDLSRTDNPDYASTQTEQQAGTSDYYDDSYLSSRAVGRALSPTGVGYNAGFTDGYNLAARSSNPFYSGLGSYWPGNSLNVSFGFGLGSMFRMRPYMGFGMGSMLSMGYSPFGFGSMMGYNAYGYDPFGYSSFGYSPYSSMYGYGIYDSYGMGYGSYGYGGYGYNPWAYNHPVVVVNNNYDRQGLSRSYGPRVAGGSRSSDRYNSGFVNNPRTSSTTSDRGSRRVAGSTDGYTSPRSSRSNDRGNTYSSGRSSAEQGSNGYSRSSVDGSNAYYSRPRSSTSSTYSTDGTNSGYSSPRSSRSSGTTYSAPSYSSPSRSQSDYSSPSRSNNSYSAPSRSSESYSAPSRSTYSAPAPSYSAPSRSYSPPASSGGGASHSTGRGPR